MNELRFDGKVALVTGAGRGLGLTYAEMLAARGARVVINDAGVDWSGAAHEAATDAAVQHLRDLGGDATGATGDVGRDAENIVATALDAYGRLDIVINNAGGGGDFDATLDAHVRGTNRVSEAAWPHLVESGRGRIVNTASNATWGSPGPAGYATAKSAILGLTRVQAANGAASGIKANTVLPSAWTRSTAGIPHEGMKQFLQTHFPPEAIGAFVLWLVHEDCEVSGEAFSLGGGHAARVVQAKGRGATVRDHTPEAWAGRMDEVMSIDSLIVPSSMWGDVGELARSVGGDVENEWERLAFDEQFTS